MELSYWSVLLEVLSILFAFLAALVATTCADYMLREDKNIPLHKRLTKYWWAFFACTFLAVAITFAGKRIDQVIAANATRDDKAEYKKDLGDYGERITKALAEYNLGVTNTYNARTGKVESVIDTLNRATVAHNKVIDEKFDQVLRSVLPCPPCPPNWQAQSPSLSGYVFAERQWIKGYVYEHYKRWKQLAGVRVSYAGNVAFTDVNGEFLLGLPTVSMPSNDDIVLTFSKEDFNTLKVPCKYKVGELQKIYLVETKKPMN